MQQAPQIDARGTTRLDGRSGRSYETPDGTYPSVTTILSVISKPALLNWAAKVEREMVTEAAWELYQDAPLTKKMARLAYMNTLNQRIGTTKAHEKLKAKAADIGSQAHALVEWDLRQRIGQKVGGRPFATSEAESAFAQYEAWRDSVNLEPVAIEQTVWHVTDRYAGTLDLLARIDGTLVVLDFKTSKAIYEEYELQIAAYAVALNEMKHGPCQSGYIVRLPKSSGDGFEVVKVQDFEITYQTFLHAKALWEWQHKNYLAWKARTAA